MRKSRRARKELRERRSWKESSWAERRNAHAQLGPGVFHQRSSTAHACVRVIEHAQCCSADGRRQALTHACAVETWRLPISGAALRMRANAARTRSNAEFVRETRAILDFKKMYLQHKNRVAVFCYKNRTKYGKDMLVGISAKAFLPLLSAS